MRLLNDGKTRWQNVGPERTAIDERLARDRIALAVIGFQHQRHVFAMRIKLAHPRRLDGPRRPQRAIAVKHETFVEARLAIRTWRENVDAKCAAAGKQARLPAMPPE